MYLNIPLKFDLHHDWLLPMMLMMLIMLMMLMMLMMLGRVV